MRFLSVEEAKNILTAEINDEHADNHSPLSVVYSRRKIINYLWACKLQNIQRGDCIDWLKEQYSKAGMTEDELWKFTLDIELAIETIEREPKQ